MTLLARLAEASERVGATSARLAKVRELAGFLRLLGPDEIRIGVQYLAGDTPQGRIGIGQGVLREAAAAPPAASAALSLTEVDKTITEVAALKGAGVN
ncbi:MAG: ATP-dependent DNA ligase, partial [Steroidobacteraceae bacterium]